MDGARGLCRARCRHQAGLQRALHSSLGVGKTGTHHRACPAHRTVDGHSDHGMGRAGDERMISFPPSSRPPNHQRRRRAQPMSHRRDFGPICRWCGWRIELQRKPKRIPCFHDPERFGVGAVAGNALLQLETRTPGAPILASPLASTPSDLPRVSIVWIPLFARDSPSWQCLALADRWRPPQGHRSSSVRQQRVSGELLILGHNCTCRHGSSLRGR